MKCKAIISVRSKQHGDKDSIEVVTPGDFYKKNNFYYAVYKETQISGMEGTTTTLKIGNDQLSLIRMGTTSTNMEFKKNKKNISLYNTPYGVLELQIDTKELKIDISEEGGEVSVSYDMNVSGSKPQNTVLKINIKAKNARDFS